MKPRVGPGDRLGTGAMCFSATLDLDDRPGPEVVHPVGVAAVEPRGVAVAHEKKRGASQGRMPRLISQCFLTAPLAPPLEARLGPAQPETDGMDQGEQEEHADRAGGQDLEDEENLVHQ